MNTASETHCFNILFSDDPDDDKGTTPLVSDYIAFENKGCRIAGEDRLVTPLERILIYFEYPVNNPINLEFQQAGGFKLSDIWRCVYQGYEKIYVEEPEPEPDPSWTLLNRPNTYGKYGIWGHTMEQLYLEGFVEKEPGLFYLLMGS